MSRHVVVVGGGAIGLMTAYQLTADGAQVTLVDARQTGRGAAEVNAGWVVPAESAPVPGPGMISASIKWMLRKDSPLYIRPSLDPTFVRFMLGMWRSCNAPTQRAGFEAHLQLAHDTVETYDRYRADGLDFELRHDGLLMAFTDPHNLEHHLANLDLVRRFGLDPQVLLGDDVRTHEPQLSDRVHGGVYFPHERHLDPPALMRSLHRRLLERGVTILENSPLEGVERHGGGLGAVRVGGHRVVGDAYVLAAGAWTGPLSRLLGVPLPVRPGKGYSIDVEPFDLRSAVNLSDAKVAVTPLRRNLRLAGTMEFGGLDEELNQVRVGAILKAPARYFRDWRPPAGPVRATAGARPMTPDGRPIIGRLGDLTNAYVCTGHGMQGLTLGPGSAAALSRLVLRDETADVLAPFAPGRFTRALVRRTPTPADVA
jgi:D-amino-acid dehydrogenase